MEPVIFIFLIIGLVIVVRLIAGGMDHDRVDRYIASQGGRVLEKHWNPFGKGWFGERDSRIYEVRYQDREGNIHKATCKTSLLSGVYFTEDRIISPLQRSGGDPGNDLAEENRRLRDEINRLKQ